MRLYAILTLVLLSVFPASSILADEAYNIDYHHALLGIPQAETTFFYRPSTSSTASLLYTISEKGVLGAINPRNGTLVWRQLLSDRLRTPISAQGKAIHTEEAPVKALGDSNGTLPSGLLASDSNGILVSYYGSMISSFNAANGKLIWRKVMHHGQHINSAQLVPARSDELSASEFDVVIIHGNFEGVFISKLAGASGSVVWEHPESSISNPMFLASDGKDILYASEQRSTIGGNSIRTRTLSLDEGRPISAETLKAEKILRTLSCSGSAFIFLYDKSTTTMKINLLGSSKVRSFTLEKSSGEEIKDVTILSSCALDSSTHFLLQIHTHSGSWAEIFQLPFRNSEISRVSVLPFAKGEQAFAVSTSDETTFFSRVTDEEIELYSGALGDVLIRWPRSQPSFGGTGHVQAEVVLRGQSSFAVRIAEVSRDGEWTLMRDGETVWSRPEMLSNAVAVAWADDFSGEALAHELDLEGHENPFGAYVHRLRRHAGDLQGFSTWFRQLPSNILSGLLTSRSEAEKGLLGSKSLIVATSTGQYLALDPIGAGKIKWKKGAEQISTRTRPTSLYVRDDVLTAYVDRVGVLTLNASDGTTISFDESDAYFTKIAIAPGAVAPVAYRFLPDGEPEPTSQGETARDGTYLVTWPVHGEDVQGWMVGKTKSRLWTFSRGHEYQILNVASRPQHDPVSSIGKVLGDRSVLYKYLSENLILITSAKSNTLAIDLLDAITGTVLYSTIHHNVNTNLSIPSVLSENWFTYSFFAHEQEPQASSPSFSSFQAPQLIVAEMYESSLANDRGPLQSSTNFSSFNPNTPVPKPHVVTQSFIVPHPIAHLSVTQTQQGITSRHLLAIVPDLDAIVTIPRQQVLNPRRPVDRDPTPQESSEEGLTSRYLPLLDLDPRLYTLSHGYEVLGVHTITTSPTLLESTGLVFAFGLDVFGTRLSPSRGFDTLGKGFNKLALVATVLALAAATTALAPLVTKKSIDRRWKA